MQYTSTRSSVEHYKDNADTLTWCPLLRFRSPLGDEALASGMRAPSSNVLEHAYTSIHSLDAAACALGIRNPALCTTRDAVHVFKMQALNMDPQEYSMRLGVACIRNQTLRRIISGVMVILHAGARTESDARQF